MSATFSSDLFISQTLTPQRLIEALQALPSILREELAPETILTARYGCLLHPDLCYRDMQVGLGWLDRFIADSLKSIFIPGDSDLAISVAPDRLTLLFCHEGDIHSGGNDLVWQERFWQRSPFADYSLRRRPAKAPSA